MTEYRRLESQSADDLTKASLDMAVSENWGGGGPFWLVQSCFKIGLGLVYEVGLGIGIWLFL